MLGGKFARDDFVMGDFVRGQLGWPRGDFVGGAFVGETLLGGNFTGPRCRICPPYFSSVVRGDLRERLASSSYLNCI